MKFSILKSQLGRAVSAAVIAMLAGSAAEVAHAQQKTITLLTWNFANRPEMVQSWIDEYEKLHPDVNVEWVDKAGRELPAYYQTQVIGGTPPDIVDFQASLWLEYAASGGLVDLTKYLESDPDVKGRYEQRYLDGWKYEGGLYMVPFYVSKTLLFYNKKMFEEAKIDGPPTSFDQIMDYAKRMTSGEKSGLVSLNFDWQYWPLFKMNDVEFLSEDFKTPAFNTEKGVQVLKALADATQAGEINKITWSGRWVEPIGAFASGNIGMFMAHSPAFFNVRSNGPWVNNDTLGVAQLPGGWATPNSHGFAISKGSKHPDIAWDFIKMVTSDRFATKLNNEAYYLSGNIKSDTEFLKRLDAEDPLAAKVLRTQLENTDKLTGNWPLPNDAKIQQTFYPELQNAVLGRKSPEQALQDAERSVSRALQR